MMTSTSGSRPHTRLAATASPWRGIRVARPVFGHGEAAHSAARSHTAQPRSRSQRPTPVSAMPGPPAEDNSRQRLLGSAAVDAAAAHSPTSSDSPRQYSNRSDSWVAYLTHLADGDAPALKAALRAAQPQLLSQPVDQQRLDQLQSHLATVLAIKPSELLLMATRHTALLSAAPSTVAAATAFFRELGLSPAALHDAAVTHPQMLGASVKALQLKLDWLTNTLGATPADALHMIPVLVKSAIATTLEPRREWLLQQGFTPAQLLRLTAVAPALLYTDTGLMQRRLDFFTHTCGIPAAGVRRMLAAQPSVMMRDLEGHLTQLKLRFWQQQLGYSLSDLPLVPIFLASSVSRIAGRHSAFCHLQDATPAHTRFRAALIAGSSAAPTHFGPKFYAAFVKQHCKVGSMGSKGSVVSAGSVGSVGSVSVQELLQPLSASLSQPALVAEWGAELASYPRLAAAGTSARKHGALYAALHSIQQRDWALSASGRQCVADEVAAKVADMAARAAARTAASAAKIPPDRAAYMQAYLARKRAAAAASAASGGFASAAAATAVRAPLAEGSA